MLQALEEQRILVTLDKDFGELVFLRGQLHAGIIRLVEVPSLSQAETIQSILVEHGKALLEGAVITLKNQRLRVRKALPR